MAVVREIRSDTGVVMTGGRINIYDRLGRELAPFGLVPRGGFHSKADFSGKTIVLAGNVDHRMWEAFSVSDFEGEDALDNWCEATLSPVAERLGAGIVFPFSGPPWYPFQRWAQQAERVFPSPIGPLLHPQYGQWHAYRAAFLFAGVIDLPMPVAGVDNPCESCRTEPCRSGCPVGAIGQGQYDVPACIAHISTAVGRDCLTNGCLARRACPIGADNRYPGAQAEFHMRAFLKSNR